MESFVTANIKWKPLRRQSNNNTPSSICISWLAVDETCREGHTRVGFWVTQHSAGVSLPLQLPQTFISALLEIRGEKNSLPQKHKAKRSNDSCQKKILPAKERWATVPSVFRTLFLLTGNNCFKSPLPKSEVFSSEWRFKCYRSNRS